MTTPTSDALVNKLRQEDRQYRGVKYTLRELPIGKYDEITKLATVISQDIDGNDLPPRIDQTAQMRLLLGATMIEPEDADIAKIPTSVVIALNGVVNILHYTEELDELMAKPKKGAKPAPAEDGEETGKG
jgi:hypothetical protein